jgi:1-phosphatidylinositol-4-phosphate 5-kinase
MLKLLRWRKKNKGSLKKKPKSYVKGKVIDGQHELYTLSIAVMIGVRTSIAKTNHILNATTHKRWVLPQDFKAMEKYEFRPTGGTGMPSHQLAHTFKFKDYSPVVFAYLRRMAGINEFDFLISVCGNANFIEFISNAKSGQFFFYSNDGRYMIKTMTNAESKFLRRILPDYFKHCCENPNTMITRFFGMYRVKLYHLRRNVKFVVMNSVYYTDKILQTFYDLKGSSLGRDAKPGQAVKKDNDLRRGLPDDAFVLPPEQRKHVHGQLEKDVDFLERVGIMDYSMLAGIHHVPPEEDRSVATAGLRGPARRRKTSDMDADALAAPTHQRKHSADSTALLGHVRRGSDDFGMGIYDALDDDDNSYLRGSTNRPLMAEYALDPETEEKKTATIEKLYWPFHHLFDIHGHRRLESTPCTTCVEGEPCKCREQDILRGAKICDFEEPLSDRKDGGFDMDTTHRNLPMIYKSPNGDQLYEGKIFYMGVIDILQEYTSRKMFESQYRMVQAAGAASCVRPQSYGERFLRFFDEYTSNGIDDSEGLEMTLDIHNSKKKRGPSKTKDQQLAEV